MYTQLCVLFAMIVVFRPCAAQVGCHNETGNAAGACRIRCEENENECANNWPDKDCSVDGTYRVCCCPSATVGCHVDADRGNIGVCLDRCEENFNECVNDGPQTCSGATNNCCCPLAPGF